MVRSTSVQSWLCHHCLGLGQRGLCWGYGPASCLLFSRRLPCRRALLGFQCMFLQLFYSAVNRSRPWRTRKWSSKNFLTNILFVCQYPSAISSFLPTFAISWAVPWNLFHILVTHENKLRKIPLAFICCHSKNRAIRSNQQKFVSVLD